MQWMFWHDTSFLVVWEWTVQDHYAARLSHRAETQSDRTTPDQVESGWKQLSIPAYVEWTIQQNQHRLSVNDLWSCKHGNAPVTWSLLCITHVLAAFIGKRDYTKVTAPFLTWVSTIFSFAYCICYVPIGCRHPFLRYWQPVLAKPTGICSLRYPEKELQGIVNSSRTCIFCTQGIMQIFTCITVWLTAFPGQCTIYWRWNTDTKLIDIANCSTSKAQYWFLKTWFWYDTIKTLQIRVPYINL
jgi:hypothetical protein